MELRTIFLLLILSACSSQQAARDPPASQINVSQRGTEMLLQAVAQQNAALAIKISRNS
jgi:predicted component of type VI protein secretion system